VAAGVEGLTRSAAQKWLEEGRVTIGGTPVKKNAKLSPGDTLLIFPPEVEDIDLIPQDIPLDIVYEDNDVIVVNKPVGMVVHPAPGHPDGTLVNALLYHCKESLSGINGERRPGIVHRIDRDTSGLLIAAKNDASHLKLAEQIKAHSFEREYRAIVLGNLRCDTGTVDAPIGRDPRERKRMAVVADGRPARTHYEVLERFTAMGHSYTFVRCILETGRTHQIRVHMKSLGHPLLGDTLYGGGSTKFEHSLGELISGQCLTATHIGFVHPTSGEFLRLDCPLPDYFEEILARLRKASQ
jgi:23S rRNA pseudouridine1911/1915/1917 synthase